MREFLIRIQSLTGIRIASPETISNIRPTPYNYLKIIAEKMAKKRPQLVMCIIPKVSPELYRSIKQYCYLENPVPCQIVTKKTMKEDHGVVSKIGIQMQCKLGAVPWTVLIPLSAPMFIGFDVCHDASKSGKSWGAMVASLDKGVGRYYSAANKHDSGEELSNAFANNVHQAVQKYAEVNNGRFPEQIIIYRDGVGEGQINTLIQHELVNIKTALSKLYAGNVRMLYIIVSKRISTKFFCTGYNPDSGTVVDDEVTISGRYDFFLISQQGGKGTVTPTYYNVIHDTIGLTADQVQRLTFKMTYLYYHCTTTIRVPAPVQYAHRLALLSAQALRDTVKNCDLLTLPYYL